MRKYDYESLKQDLINNYQNKEAKDFTLKYGASLNTIYQLASELKLTSNQIWDKQKNDILDDYNKGLNLRKIASKYGHDKSRVRKFLIKNGIHIRTQRESHQKYKLNEDYFKQIDTAEKAYWLGFIYADGNVYQNKIQIGLAGKDQIMLEKFLVALDSNHNIYPDGDGCHLAIRCPEIVNDLNNLGVYPRKSLVLLPPTPEQVPDKFINSFILGYFDGDGCMQTHIKNKRWTFSIIGTKECCEFIQNILIKKINFTKTKLSHDNRTGNGRNVWEVIYGGGFKTERGKKPVKKLFDFLYSENIFSLDRKKNKFLQILN